MLSAGVEAAHVWLATGWRLDWKKAKKIGLTERKKIFDQLNFKMVTSNF